MSKRTLPSLQPTGRVRFNIERFRRSKRSLGLSLQPTGRVRFNIISLRNRSSLYSYNLCNPPAEHGLTF